MNALRYQNSLYPVNDFLKNINEIVMLVLYQLMCMHFWVGYNLDFMNTRKRSISKSNQMRITVILFLYEVI